MRGEDTRAPYDPKSARPPFPTVFSMPLSRAHELVYFDARMCSTHCPISRAATYMRGQRNREVGQLGDAFARTRGARTSKKKKKRGKINVASLVHGREVYLSRSPFTSR